MTSIAVKASEIKGFSSKPLKSYKTQAYQKFNFYATKKTFQAFTKETGVMTKQNNTINGLFILLCGLLLGFAYLNTKMADALSHDLALNKQSQTEQQKQTDLLPAP